MTNKPALTGSFQCHQQTTRGDSAPNAEKWGSFCLTQRNCVIFRYISTKLGGKMYTSLFKKQLCKISCKQALLKYQQTSQQTFTLSIWWLLISWQAVSLVCMCRITFCHLPFQAKWMYVGTDHGNVHVMNIETFSLSGYAIMWNKAIELWVYLTPQLLNA